MSMNVNAISSIGQPERPVKSIAQKTVIPPTKFKEMLKLKQVTQEFESLFLAHMLNKMSQTTFKSDFIDESAAGSIFKEMYHDELAKTMAKSGGIGLAAVLYNQMVKQL